MRPVRVGCSGWQYDSWRGRMYPEGTAKRRWLETYAKHFDTVEVNSTFYRLASRRAVAAWVEQTPEDFRFAVKASRYLTHIRRLHEIDAGIGRFLEPLEPLIEADRLGPILWQLPENFHRDDARLHEWLTGLPKGPAGRPFAHTIEFRHPSWFCEPVFDALRAREVALTIADHKARPAQPYAVTAPWMFVRFHWGARGRRGNYSATELDEWAARIGEWRTRRTVWAYFNNDWEGFAPRNATGLCRRLRADPAGQSSSTRSTGTPKRSSSTAGSTSSR